MKLDACGIMTSDTFEKRNKGFFKPIHFNRQIIGWFIGNSLVSSPTILFKNGSGTSGFGKSISFQVGVKSGGGGVIRG